MVCAVCRPCKGFAIIGAAPTSGNSTLLARFARPKWPWPLLPLMPKPLIPFPIHGHFSSVQDVMQNWRKVSPKTQPHPEKLSAHKNKSKNYLLDPFVVNRVV